MRKLLSLLNIHSEESGLVGLILAFGVLLYAGNIFTQTVCLSLFLNAYDASSLPLTYIGISIFATAISMIYLRLNARFSLSFVLIGNMVVMKIMLIVYRIGIGLASAPWLVFSLPIYFGVANILTMTAFWNLLGRMFNLQQGKHLFNLLMASENIATILIGFFAPVLVGWWGTLNLFVIAAGVLVAAFAVLILILRRYAPLMQPTQSDPLPQAAESKRRLPLNRYVGFITFSFSLFIVSIYLIDNLFYTQVTAQFTSEATLTDFICTFLGIVGVVSLMLQVFVFGWVLRRFGVRASILITPILLSVCLLLFAFFGTFTTQTVPLFALIVGANLFRLVMDPNDLSALNILFQPLPSKQRTQVQTFVDGSSTPLARGAAGVLLLVLVDGLGFNAVQVAHVLLVILALWITAIFALRREYPHQLFQALTGSRSSLRICSRQLIEMAHEQIDLEGAARRAAAQQSV